MTVDREQIRQDANAVIEEFAFDKPGTAIRCAHHCLTLLDELQQTEQRVQRHKEAEARIASVLTALAEEGETA